MKNGLRVRLVLFSFVLLLIAGFVLPGWFFSRHVPFNRITGDLQNFLPVSEPQAAKLSAGDQTKLVPDLNELKQPKVSDVYSLRKQNQQTSSNSEETEVENFDGYRDFSKLEIIRPSSQPAPAPRATANLSDNPQPSVPLRGFTTSSINTGAEGVGVNQSFQVTFDRDVPSQVYENLQFYPASEFDKRLEGRVLTVWPKRLKRYTSYVFGLLYNNLCQFSDSQCPQVANPYFYALSFRTAPYEVYTYGKSVQGRDLVAHIFGREGATGKKIMLNGAIHGNEWRSGELGLFIEWLKANQNSVIASDKTFFISPNLNPDGVAVNSRFNSRGVDLNRNFPTAWGPCARCGSGPLSEPESKQLYDFTLQVDPDYLISYHAQWPPNGIIFLGNDDNGRTLTFADYVANKTGYPVGVYPGSDVVPGDQTVWAETAGIVSLIVEAKSVNYSDIDKNWPLYMSLFFEF